MTTKGTENAAQERVGSATKASKYDGKGPNAHAQAQEY
jgi:hypothetical protein